jgi:hypothetical protein
MNPSESYQNPHPKQTYTALRALPLGNRQPRYKRGITFQQLLLAHWLHWLCTVLLTTQDTHVYKWGGCWNVTSIRLQVAATSSVLLLNCRKWIIKAIYWFRPTVITVTSAENSDTRVGVDEDSSLARELKWELSVNKWSDMKCSDMEWTDVIYVKWFYFEVKWSEVKWSEVKWVTVKFLEIKVPCTLGWPYTWLYCDYLIWVYLVLCLNLYCGSLKLFCNVWVCVCVGVLVICTLLFTVFCIVCTEFL